MLISRFGRLGLRSAVAALTVVAGGAFAVSVGHGAAQAALGSLSSLSATVTALSPASPSSPIAGATTAAPPAPAAAPAGLSAQQFQQLSERMAPVVSHLAALASKEQVAQVCAALADGGAPQAAVKAQVRAHLPSADQVISDRQLDALLTSADAQLC